MNRKLAVPDAAPLVLSLRSVGYTLETALADIIDNSIAAKATEIYIDVKWNKELDYISVRDNGYGMNEDNLHQAMKIGSKNPIDPRRHDDLGRFGMGLKTAAFSLCKRLTVGSKLLGSDAICVRVWDIDNIMDSNRWELFDDSSTSAWEDALSRFGKLRARNNCCNGKIGQTHYGKLQRSSNWPFLAADCRYGKALVHDFSQVLVRSASDTYFYKWAKN